MLVQRHTSIIEEIVQSVVIPSVLCICRPYILGRPIVERIGRNTLSRSVRPRISIPHLIIFVAVHGTPSVKAFASPYTYKATHTTIFRCKPFAELILKVVIPHPFRKERKILFRHCPLWHILYPKFAFTRLIRPPKMLKHTCAGSHFERHANMINIRFILKSLKRSHHVVGRFCILCLVVHMKNAKPATTLLSYFCAQFKQHTAILTAAK